MMSKSQLHVQMCKSRECLGSSASLHHLLPAGSTSAACNAHEVYFTYNVHVAAPSSCWLIGCIAKLRPSTSVACERLNCSNFLQPRASWRFITQTYGCTGLLMGVLQQTSEALAQSWAWGLRHVSKTAAQFRLALYWVPAACPALHISTLWGWHSFPATYCRRQSLQLVQLCTYQLCEAGILSQQLIAGDSDGLSLWLEVLPAC